MQPPKRMMQADDHANKRKARDDTAIK